MKTQIAVIKEALEIIKENPKDQKVINEQARLIIKYAKELIIRETTVNFSTYQNQE